MVEVAESVDEGVEVCVGVPERTAVWVVVYKTVTEGVAVKDQAVVGVCNGVAVRVSVWIGVSKGVSVRVGVRNPGLVGVQLGVSKWVPVVVSVCVTVLVTRAVMLPVCVSPGVWEAVQLSVADVSNTCVAPPGDQGVTVGTGVRRFARTVETKPATFVTCGF